MDNAWMDSLKFDANGLIPAIIQDHRDGQVLMVAWMNRDSLQDTLKTGKTHFWSRSRKKYWMKGEESGNVQEVRDVFYDCDADVLLFKVEQVGGAACHTGHRSCFFMRVTEQGPRETEAPVFDPAQVYKH
ncbi:MAG: phosphoribosyl-AMP cyclohydrolase [bacterium]